MSSDRTVVMVMLRYSVSSYSHSLTVYCLGSGSPAIASYFRSGIRTRKATQRETLAAPSGSLLIFFSSLWSPVLLCSQHTTQTACFSQLSTNSFSSTTFSFSLCVASVRRLANLLIITLENTIRFGQSTIGIEGLAAKWRLFQTDPIRSDRADRPL